MRKEKPKKSPKSRRPLYYVENPDDLELLLLDEITETEPELAKVSSLAAAEPQMSETEGPEPDGDFSIETEMNETDIESPAEPIEAMISDAEETEISEA